MEETIKAREELARKREGKTAKTKMLRIQGPASQEREPEVGGKEI